MMSTIKKINVKPRNGGMDNLSIRQSNNDIPYIKKIENNDTEVDTLDFSEKNDVDKNNILSELPDNILKEIEFYNKEIISNDSQCYTINCYNQETGTLESAIILYPWGEIAETDFYDNGKIKTVSMYNRESGMLLEERIYDQHETVKSISIFDSETGKLKTKNIFNGNNNSNYFYDGESGEITKKTEYTNGKLVSVTMYDNERITSESIYDKMGNITYINYFDIETGKVCSRDIYTEVGINTEKYDLDTGKVIERTIIDNVNRKITKLSYDEESFLVTKKVEYINNALSSITEYENGKRYKENIYDGDGNLSCLNFYDIKSNNLISKFEYDNKGNIINKVDFTQNIDMLMVVDMEYIKNTTTVITDDNKKNYDEEISRNKNNLDVINILESINTEDKDKIFYYYANIDNIYGDKKSFPEKIKLSKALMDFDSDNYVLYSTPIMATGTIKDISCHVGYGDYNGYYLKFYNEDELPFYVPLKMISKNNDGYYYFAEMDEDLKNEYIDKVSNYYAGFMKMQEVYSDNFRDKTYNYLDNVVCIYYENKEEAIGSVTGWTSGVETKGGLGSLSKMGLNGNNLFSDYSFMLSTFSHELGHVFANSSGILDSGSRKAPIESWKDIDDRKEWLEIYEQINGSDADYTFLREYAHSSPAEFFAEAVAEYYSTEFSNLTYNSDDLKMIEINVDGFDNLYDYMASVLD